MDEISSILETKEKVEWKGKPKISAYFISQIFNILLFGVIAGVILFTTKIPNYLLWFYGLIGLCILILISGILNYFFIYYAVTNKRMIFQRGVIGRNFKSIDYDKIQNVSVSRGIIGVIFNVGNIRIFTGEMEAVSSKNGTSMRSKYDIMSNVPDAYSVLKNIQTHLEERKESLYSGKTK